MECSLADAHNRGVVVNHVRKQGAGIRSVHLLSKAVELPLALGRCRPVVKEVSQEGEGASGAACKYNFVLGAFGAKMAAHDMHHTKG